jgi:hypothetical protein
MKDIKVGIVTEGGSDCVVLETLLLAYFKKAPVDNFSLSFKNLQPYVDNTSKSGYSEGGWEQVYKWCIGNPPQERISTLFGGPLFADDMDDFQCSALLVHMDADICEKIGDKSNVVPVPDKTQSAQIRGKFISETLAYWLWPDAPNEDHRHILVPAVESTEAWLVAGLSDDTEDPEGDHDIQRHLAELDYSVVKGRPVPKNIKKPNKQAENFRKISEVAAGNVMRIIERCPHFELTVRKIVALIDFELKVA